ncbi:MAG: hypothetical protein ABIX46_00405 [Burkholderiaceae bacterium]
MSAVMTHPGVDSAASDSSSAGQPPVATELSAVERLERSREHIRQSIDAMAVPPPRLLATTVGAAPGSTLEAMLEKLLNLPGVDIVVDTAQSWWKYHPWRAVGVVMADASRSAVAPIAKRHPVTLMLGAALAGALLLRWGPWRWVAKRTLLAGFIPRLATRLAANVPMESWLSALAVLRRPATRATASASTPPRT